MAIKELQTRIALKYDSYSAWTSAPGKDLVLLAGELGICYVGDANQGSQVVPTVLFKVGNGTSTFEQLPWASAKAADVYSWAKSETVVLDGTTLKFKTGDAVNHTVDLSSFATDAEVETIRSGLDSRITALESKFTGEGAVQTQIDALDSRLDAIEGEDGLIAQAEKAAKDYTDTREAAIKTAYEAYADQAEADAKKDAADNLAAAVETLEAADTALDGRLDVIEGEGEGSVKKALADAKSYADQAELDAVASANAYTDGRETAIKAAYEKYADDAEQAAKDYADDEIAKAVETQAAVDAAQNTEIGKKLDKTTFDAFNNGTSKSVSEIEADIVSKAGTAKSEAIAAAKTETETQVNALANGQVKTNKEAIAAMDAAYKAADEALDGRLDTVEAKLANVTNVMDFRGAVTALPEVAGYQNGDVIVVTDGDNKGKEYVLSEGAWVEFGNTDANSAAISALQGRMTTAEGDIDKLEKADEALVAEDTAIKGRLDIIEGEGAGSIKKAQADAEANAKTYTDGRETVIRSELKTAYEGYADQAELDAIAAAKNYTDGEVDKLESKDAAIEGNVKTLQDLTSGYTGAGSIKNAVDAAQKAADDAQDAADAAQEAADNAQDEIDALELVVGDANTGLAKTKEIADKATTDIAALTTRMGTAESDIDAIQAIVSAEGGNSNAQLRSDITDLQTLTGDAAKGNEALRTELTALQGVVNHTTTGLAATKAIADEAKSDAEDAQSRVAKIEADYLKEADLFIINCGSSTKVTHTSETSEA